MFPTIERPLAQYLGVRVDGVGTTRFSGAFRIERPMQPEVGRAIQVIIEKGYEDFLARVSEARSMPRDEVDKVARGRVWSGKDALERKLVDKLGGLREAIASAAERAKLPKDHRTWWVEEEQKFAERVLSKLMKGTLRVAGWLGVEVGTPETPALPPALRALQIQVAGAERLLRLNDPQGVYALDVLDVR
jgi:protease-4